VSLIGCSWGVLGSVGKGPLRKEFGKTVKAIEARNDGARPAVSR
jgi:hypothetical protein